MDRWEIAEWLYKKDHGLISYGLFAGMKLSPEQPWIDGNQCLKLLGAYEEYLQPHIRKALDRKPARIINVGCAEGYYAVGLGRLVRDRKVLNYACDKEELCREVCIKNAELNGISLITVGALNPGNLSILIGSGAFVLMDCEGAETELADPEKCRNIKNADLIIECHDFMTVKKNVTQFLVDRLKPTHKVEVLTPTDSDPLNFPILHDLSNEERVETMRENRPAGTLFIIAWVK